MSDDLVAQLDAMGAENARLRAAIARWPRRRAMPADRCEPPPDAYHEPYHWLKRFDTMTVAEWRRHSRYGNAWFFLGGAHPISPEEASWNSYRYVGPCKPPETGP